MILRGDAALFQRGLQRGDTYQRRLASEILTNVRRDSAARGLLFQERHCLIDAGIRPTELESYRPILFHRRSRTVPRILQPKA